MSSVQAVTTTNHYEGRQRLAWAFLLGSYCVCIFLTITIPLTVAAYVQAARRPLSLAVQTNQGTIAIFHEGAGLPLLAGAAEATVEAGANIQTSVTDTALLTVLAPDNETLLARIQIYGHTNVNIEEAEAPRYKSLSLAERQLTLNLTNGRLRITVLPPVDEGTFVLVVQLPQGKITIREAGQYSVDASNVTAQVAVQSGLALVEAAGELRELVSDQRVEIPTGSPPTQLLHTERNLVRNGNFRADLTGWDLFVWNLELSDQPAGETGIIAPAGEPFLFLKRVGIGHADTRIRQTINQDVTDFESLRLFVTLRIVSQSLEVCGQVGSECPLAVWIEYEDAGGARRTWHQGFYAVGEMTPDTPTVCRTCAAPYSTHQQVPLGQLFPYESENLVEMLAQQGLPPPRRILSLSLVASGHSFETEVVEVGLVAKE